MSNPKVNAKGGTYRQGVGYPTPLRQRVAASGSSLRTAASIFRMASSTVYQYRSRRHRGVSLTRHRKGGLRQGSVKLHPAALECLNLLVKHRPAQYQKEYAAMLEENLGIHVTQSTIARALQALGLSRKKSSRISVIKYRFGDRYAQFLAWRACQDPHLLFYMDESLVSPKDAIRPYVYSPVGERCEIPGGYGRAADVYPHETNGYTLCAMVNIANADRPVVFDVFNGNSNAHTFLSFLTDFILPAMPPGGTLIMDGARYHLAKWTIPVVETLLTVFDCHLFVLPPYSPELNPTELLFALVKKKLRTAIPGNELLLELITSCTSNVSIATVLNWYDCTGHNNVF